MERAQAPDYKRGRGDQLVKTAIEVAMDWLATAEMSLKDKRYEQSLYSMEMSVEIAFKAVLISLKHEVPKVHDISEIAREYLAGNQKLPEGFLGGLEDYLSTFNILLGFRPIVGYGFGEKFEKWDFSAEAKRLLPECTKIVSACDGAIKSVSKK
jgi:HEPN domain-containing protein